MSDVFLFEEVGVRVSVNGDHHLAERSDIAVEGTDLLLAYRAARELADGGRLGPRNADLLHCLAARAPVPGRRKVFIERGLY